MPESGSTGTAAGRPSWLPISGVLSVFFDLAYQSYLPAIVDREQLVEGNSKMVVSMSIATVTGLSAAGVVI